MIINKVYHLADLHIRNLQRHKEYRIDNKSKIVNRVNTSITKIMNSIISKIFDNRCEYIKSVGII